MIYTVAALPTYWITKSLGARAIGGAVIGFVVMMVLTLNGSQGDPLQSVLCLWAMYAPFVVTYAALDYWWMRRRLAAEDRWARPKEHG